MLAMLIGFWLHMWLSGIQSKRRDDRIEQGIKDLHRHRDSLIGRDEDEA